MRLLFSFWFLVLSLVAHTQNMRFSHLDQKQGLSQNTAGTFLQDRDGFMWVGTQDGLNRYDGYSFTVYRTIAGDTHSIPDNFILTLAEDNDGNIWIGTRNGLCVYVKTEDRFYRYYSSYDHPGDFHASIRQLFALREGGVVYRTTSQHVLSVKYFPSLHRVDTTAAVHENDVQTFTYHYNSNRLAVMRDRSFLIGEPGTLRLLPDLTLRARTVPLMALSDELLYVTDSTRVWRYPLTANGAATVVWISDVLPTTLAIGNNNSIWLGTADGLRVLPDPGRTSQVIVAREQREDYFSLSGSRVEHIYFTREGIAWIGTVGGINVYDPLQARFSVLQGVFSESNAGAIWMVLSFGNTTLWATNNGLNYRVQGTTPEWLRALPQKLLYSAGAFDSRGRLWLGTKNQGVLIVDTATGTIDERFRYHPDYTVPVMDFCCDRAGHLWIAGIGSLSFVNEETLEPTFLRKKNEVSRLPSNYFSAIDCDEQGTVFVATARGVVCYPQNDTAFTVLDNNPSDPNSLAYNIVNDVIVQGRVLWLATMGYGLDRYDRNTQTFTHYTTADGLSNNTIYGMEMYDGKLWLSSNEGLILFDTSGGTSRHFTMRDGLPSNEFVINKHAFNVYSGQMLFGSSNGLVEFDPDDFGTGTSEVTPVLSRLLVNYKPRAFYGDSILLLSSDERNVSFEFTAIDFRNQDKIRYAYRLEGFDSTWHDVESYNRLANFTNLPYGDYTFMVRYRISGEQWSEPMLQLRVHIETPFYATWWFMIILIAAGISVVALIVRYISQRRLRKQLEELKLQEEIRNEKERISRDLHDNVGAQLTYVISSLDNLSYTLHRKNTAEQESQRLEQLGEFARGTMNQLRESIWAMNSEQISLSELTGKWKQHLSQLSETKALSGRVTRTGDDVIIKPTVAIEIHRIVQEAISNAFRHSGGDSIEINVHNDAETLTIMVSDNGKGIPPSPEKPGHYGLQNMKKRASHIHADLEITSAEKGAQITLRWKLN